MWIHISSMFLDKDIYQRSKPDNYHYRCCNGNGGINIASQLFKLSFADFDGCMYGLKATRGSVAGEPIRKPWRVACSPNSTLPKWLCKRCDGTHTHTPCAGQNTLGTQSYTDEIVNVFHRCYANDVSQCRGVTSGAAVARS